MPSVHVHVLRNTTNDLYRWQSEMNPSSSL